jgi:hypothetical protein
LSNPDGQFGITDSTDYDALTSRIALLGVALSGIESYVAEESMLRRLAHISDGTQRRKEPVPLELIRARLDTIHGKICTSVLFANATVSLAYQLVRVHPQLTRVPPISIDLEQRVLYNAFQCVYIINVLPSPRLVGNYAWATFSALAETLDSRSVEIGRRPYQSFYNPLRRVQCWFSVFLFLYCSFFHCTCHLIEDIINLGLRPAFRRHNY